MLRRELFHYVYKQCRFCSRLYSAAGQRTENTRKMESQVFQEIVARYQNYYLVRKIFQKHPNFERSDFYYWRQFMDTLYTFGFQHNEALRMISIYPEALSFSDEKLKEVLEEWRVRSTLDTERFKSLIISRPIYLNAKIKHIRQRVPFLLSYASTEYFSLLLLLCPNLLFDDWDDITKKMNYLSDEVVVFRTEVLTSKALSHPLEHIKLRFSVLDKCGLYIKPSLYEYKQTRKERHLLNNPKLKNITDSTDQYFSTIVAKITLYEYEVYKNMFLKELNEELSDSDSDSD